MLFGAVLLVVVTKVSGEFGYRLIDADKNEYNSVNCAYTPPCEGGQFEEDARFRFTYSYEKPVPLSSMEVSYDGECLGVDTGHEESVVLTVKRLLDGGGDYTQPVDIIVDNKTESVKPYTLFGDQAFYGGDGSYTGQRFQSGMYSLTVKAYAEDYAQGKLLCDESLLFYVKNCPETEPGLPSVVCGFD